MPHHLTGGNTRTRTLDPPPSDRTTVTSLSFITPPGSCRRVCVGARSNKRERPLAAAVGRDIRYMPNIIHTHVNALLCIIHTRDDWRVGLCVCVWVRAVRCLVLFLETTIIIKSYFTRLVSHSVSHTRHRRRIVGIVPRFLLIFLLFWSTVTVYY